jgi:hypothetical protein
LYEVVVQEMSCNVSQAWQIQVAAPVRPHIVVRIHQRSKLETPCEVSVKTLLSTSLIHFLLIRNFW